MRVKLLRALLVYCSLCSTVGIHPAEGRESLVAAARSYLGTNPTGWHRDWCAHFLDLILRQTGHRGGGNLALKYLNYGHRVWGPQVGAIAVMGRRGRAKGGSPGGHVGVVTAVDANGNPVIISGNHDHHVGIGTYPKGRIIAYILPD